MNCGTTHHEGCPCHEARRNASTHAAEPFVLDDPDGWAPSAARLRARVVQRTVPPPEDDELTWRYAVQMVAADSLWLADEVERLREQVAINEERYAAWRRRWEDMSGIAVENKAEIERLRDGIRQVDEWERRSVGEVNDFTGLRRIIDPLLEENHDER